MRNHTSRRLVGLAGALLAGVAALAFAGPGGPLVLAQRRRRLGHTL